MLDALHSRLHRHFHKAFFVMMVVSGLMGTASMAAAVWLIVAAAQFLGRQ